MFCPGSAAAKKWNKLSIITLPFWHSLLMFHRVANVCFHRPTNTSTSYSPSIKVKIQICKAKLSTGISRIQILWAFLRNFRTGSGLININLFFVLLCLTIFTYFIILHLLLFLFIPIYSIICPSRLLFRIG